MRSNRPPNLAAPAGRAAFAAAAVLLSCGAACAQPAQITVIDHLSAGQLEETIAVYIAGHLAGNLHVDADHPDDSFTTGVAVGRVPYALCGLLRRQRPDGSIADLPIDNRGELRTKPGGHYFAFTLNDRMFALVEEVAGGRGENLTPGPACAAAVS